MSAGSAENRLTMTFQSTPPVENGSDNVDEESPKNDKPRTDRNGDTNMTDIGVTYPSLDGLDVADGNQPYAGGAADPNTNHPNPPSASDSGAIPSHDGRKYNKDQRREVNRVLKCKVRDYYAILDVASVANESQIRRAYHRLCTKIHPDKNQDKDSTTAFQSK